MLLKDWVKPDLGMNFCKRIYKNLVGVVRSEKKKRLWCVDELVYMQKDCGVDRTNEAVEKWGERRFSIYSFIISCLFQIEKTWAF